jgi:hypothetical protein
LKEEISKLSKIPVDRQRLFFGAFELDNPQQSLSNLNLRDGSVIHLVEGKKIRLPQSPLGSISVFGFQNNRWIVRNFDHGDVKVTEATHQHSVHIENCNNTKIRISTKVNHINIVSCKNSIIHFQGVVSSVELTRCENLRVYNWGTLYTLQVDLSNDLHLYISPRTIENCKIITANSSNIFFKPILEQNSQHNETQIPSSILTDQMVTHFDRDTKEMKTVSSNALKREGYVLIANLH